MYTSHIGNRFLNHHNKMNGSDLTARKYFDEKLWTLFFDNEKYLQWITNSPFVQGIRKVRPPKQVERRKKLARFHELLSSRPPDASIAVGYPAAGLLETTSGQVSSMSLPLDEEDMYASWIGSAFGVGIEGGLNILFDNEEIMSVIEEGWELYRKYVNQNDGIDNKIDTWNGIWLCHRLSEQYDPKKPTANFQPIIVGKKGEAILERLPWTRTIFALAKTFPKSVLMGYVYSFGQMNKTVGFIRINLPEVKRLADVYKQLFGKIPDLRNQKLDEIYQAERGFDHACEQGVIGLRGIEPKGLRKFMPGRSDKNELPKEKQNIESRINNSIYISWIVAMLNNKELVALAEKASAMLHAYVAGETRARTIRSNNVEKILNARSRRELIDSLTPLLEDDSTAEVCNSIVNEAMLNIPSDNVSLFITLMRFKFALPKN